jgi:hypothetical protein
MSTLFRISGTLVLTSLLVAAAWGCSSEDDDGGLTPGGSAGTAGTGGTLGIDAGNGEDAGSTGGSGDGVGGNDDGVSAPPACEGLDELKGCGESSVEAEFRTTNILLVIDKSGSMDDQPEGFESNKWEALKGALEEALPDVAEEMNFGVVLYPYSADEQIPLDCNGDICCTAPTGGTINVPIEKGTESVPKILSELDNTSPGGGTPTAAALEAAYQYYTQGAGASLKGDRYVLLATDGGPNCNGLNSCEGSTCTPNLDGQCSIDNCCDGMGTYCLDDASVIEQIEALKDAGISTFVIGIPGTEQYAEYLDQFAVAGGVPNPSGDPDYYAVSAEDGVAALAQTFKDITTHLVRGCEVPLEYEAPDRNKVNVAVNCEVVPHDDGAGWEISEDDAKVLILKGETCDWIQEEGARRIDVFFGCNTIR